MSEIPKPCPFCGKQNAKLTMYGPESLFAVNCECGAGVRGFDQCRQDAVEAWNTRSSADSAQPIEYSSGREYRQKFIDRAQRFVDRNSARYGDKVGHNEDAKLMIDMIALVNSLDAALQISYSLRTEPQSASVREEMVKLRDDCLHESKKTDRCYTCYTDQAAYIARRIDVILAGETWLQSQADSSPQTALMARARNALQAARDALRPYAKIDYDADNQPQPNNAFDVDQICREALYEIDVAEPITRCADCPSRYLNGGCSGCPEDAPLAVERSQAVSAATPAWQCSARKQGTAGGNTPADCDWPGCGCDPNANKVLDAIDEAGFEITRKTEPTPWDANHNRSYEPVETLAKEIYGGFVYDGPAGTKKPNWLPGGNGTKQDEARFEARRRLREAGHTPALTPQTSRQCLESAPQEGSKP